MAFIRSARKGSALLAGALALGISAFAPLAHAKAPPCVKGEDENALQVRVVQTELMVAALSCNASPRYNAFVQTYQKDLMAAHNQLRKLFKRIYGGSANTELNAFITRLANDSSKRSIANITIFCQNATTMYDGALVTEGVQLAAFVPAQPVAQLHGFESCAAVQTASLDDDVPLPRPKPAN